MEQITKRRMGIAALSLSAILLAVWANRSQLAKLTSGEQIADASTTAIRQSSLQFRPQNTIGVHPPQLLSMDAERKRTPLPLELPTPVNTRAFDTRLGAFHAGKHNVFFSERQFVTEWLKNEPELPEKLVAMLVEPPLHPTRDRDDVDSPPEEVTQRMAALDVLEILAHDTSAQEAARTALGSIIRQPVPSTNDEALKRNLIVEKMEAMEAICRVDVPDCVGALRGVEHPALRAKLDVAAQRALIDSGFGANEARALLSTH